MSLTSRADDVELFTALNRALAELSELDAPTGERRANRRAPFRCVQLLAPFDGEHLPAQADYAALEFQDLSTSGFSYLADRPPQRRWVIAALGKTPFKFFVAEVAHERAAQCRGEAKVLVGCRFLRRIT